MTDTRRPHLERATYVRLYRAEVKRRLADQEDRQAALNEAAELIDDPPEELDGMRILDLLRSCRQMGRRSALTMMLHARIEDAEKLIGRLSVEDRKRLVSVLRGEA